MQRLKIDEARNKFGNKNISGLFPVYNSDIDRFKGLKFYDYLSIELKKDRNLNFHRKYWAILSTSVFHGIIEKIIEKYEYSIVFFKSYDYINISKANLYLLSKQLSIFFKWIFLEHEFNETPNGICELWTSIKFEEMDETKFEEYAILVFNEICDLLQISLEDLEREHIEFL